jgi:hypothetical protein
MPGILETIHYLFTADRLGLIVQEDTHDYFILVWKLLYFPFMFTEQEYQAERQKLMTYGKLIETTQPQPFKRFPKNKQYDSDSKGGHEDQAFLRSRVYNTMYWYLVMNPDNTYKNSYYGDHRALHGVHNNEDNLQKYEYQPGQNTYTGNDCLFSIDTFGNVPTQQKAYLLLNNGRVVSYEPVPTNLDVKSAKISDGIVKYQSQIRAGGLHDNIFDVNQYAEVFNLPYGGGSVTISQRQRNYGNHHMLKSMKATYFLPPSFVNTAVMKKNNLILLNYEKSLLINDHGFVVIDTAQAEKLQYKSTFDTATSMCNVTARDPAGKYSQTKFIDSTEAAYLVKQGGTLYAFDLRYPSPITTVLPEEKEYPTIQKSEDKPEIKEELIFLDEKTTVTNNTRNSAQLENKDVVKNTRVGKICGSLPSRDHTAPLMGFAKRYLNPPLMTNEGLKINFPKYAKEFVGEIKKLTGELIKSDKYLKQKHIDELQKVTAGTEYGERKCQKTAGFVKAEIYPNGAKWNRFISNQDPLLVARLMCFVGPMQKAFAKAIPWYAPGKKYKLTNVIAGTKDGDFSSFEGSQRYIRASLETELASLFNAESKAELIKLLLDEHCTLFQFQLTSRMKKKLHMKDPSDKIIIDALIARISGSAITTVGNTMMAGFLQYIFYRVSMEYSIDKSFRYIRLCYGDDSKADADHFDRYAAFVKHLGFNLEEEKALCAGHSRFCGKIMDTNGKSTLDAKRAIAKVCISFGNYSDLINILNKWSGFYNPSCQLHLDNPLAVLGHMSYLYLKNENKLDLKSDKEYKSAVDGNGVNDTFEFVFGNKAKRMLLSGEIIKIFNDHIGDGFDKFGPAIGELFYPFVDGYLVNKGKKDGKVEVNNIPWFDTQKPYLLDNAVRGVCIHNFLVKKYSKLYPGYPIVSVGKYIHRVKKVLKAVDVPFVEPSTFVNSKGETVIKLPRLCVNSRNYSEGAHRKQHKYNNNKTIRNNNDKTKKTNFKKNKQTKRPKVKQSKNPGQERNKPVQENK